MARLPTKIITVIAVLSLVGCASVAVPPPARTFPEAPEQLLKACEDLTTIGKSEVKFSELMNTVNINYTKYHSCASVAEAWQEWYKDQKKIFDEVK
jgi:hypothetical protein